MYTPSINWEKIKSEIFRLTDIDELKKEMARLTNEVKKFDINAHLSPTAKAKLKDLEKRYHQVVTTVNQAQKHIDTEIAKVLSTLKRTRVEAEKRLKVVKKNAEKHKKKIKKVSKQLKRKVSKKPARRSGARKKTSSAAV